MIDPAEPCATHDHGRKLEPLDHVHDIGLRRNRHADATDAFHHDKIVPMAEQAIDLPDHAQIDAPPFRLRGGKRRHRLFERIGTNGAEGFLAFHGGPQACRT